MSLSVGLSTTVSNTRFSPSSRRPILAEHVRYPVFAQSSQSEDFQKKCRKPEDPLSNDPAIFRLHRRAVVNAYRELLDFGSKDLSEADFLDSFE
ncbi:MAG: hypothetical protein AUI95_00790 [Crenarchaeota archaeon 13_1_40CM_3_52_4]|nr:MAG: hypothetical protein AUI95_00790 [Crenarchaeota archaeon 13_1_40CM_3_52_4]